MWESGHGQKQNMPRFKFDKWWIQHDEFKDLVAKIWNTKVAGGVPWRDGRTKLGCLEIKQRVEVLMWKLTSGEERRD
jgi:hypothetical protein